MSLIARIEEELRDAMRARDAERTGTLRLTLSALRSAEKELLRPLHDDEELQVLQRERKRRIEAAEAFRAAGRDLGRVMADVMPQVAGRADGSVVSQLVREKLA